MTSSVFPPFLLQLSAPTTALATALASPRLVSLLIAVSLPPAPPPSPLTPAATTGSRSSAASATSATVALIAPSVRCRPPYAFSGSVLSLYSRTFPSTLFFCRAFFPPQSSALPTLTPSVATVAPRAAIARAVVSATTRPASACVTRVTTARPASSRPSSRKLHQRVGLLLPSLT